MAKSAPKSVTLNSVATDVRSLTKMVESGFADMRAELSKKADKTDIALLKGDIVGLKEDINNLSTTTKLGFDEIHLVLDAKASKTDVDQSRDGVKQRLSHLDNRLDTFVGFEKRLVKVEKSVGITV